MSLRPQLSPFKVITNGDMSLTTITSLVTIIQKISLPSFTVSWAGTSPVGTLSVQVSNDYAKDAIGNTVVNAGTWNDVTLQTSSGSLITAITVSGNTGSAQIDMPITGAYAVRLLYTKGSGTGTLNATITGKVS